jgi:acetyl esterase/lipase
MNSLRWCLLALGLALFACSLLTVVKAPTLTGWKLAILAGSYGQWLAPLALGTALVAGWSMRSRGLIPAAGAGVLPAVALLLFLRPTFSAVRIARGLPARLTAAFGPGAVGPYPFDWLRLYGGARGPNALIETRVFARPGTPDATALDFYRAQRRDGRPAPCVVTIHGGGWDNGDRSQLPELNHRLAREGYAVAALDYRLAPRWRWPAQSEDVALALAYLKAHAVELGLDPTDFVLFGRSAGGQIATAYAYQAGDPAIRGVVSFYGPQDLRFAWDYARPDDVLNSFQLLKQYLGGGPEDEPAAYGTSSALFHVGPRTPPTLLIHGALDTLVWHRQSERLDARLAAERVPHLFLSLPWATHAFDYNLDGPGGQLATGALDAFLAALTH